MAGCILISKHQALSLGGPAFRYVAGRIREHLMRSGEEALVLDLYQGIGEGLEILNLQTLGRAQFSTVFAGVSTDFENLSERERYNKQALEMLLDKLRLDRRAA